MTYVFLGRRERECDSDSVLPATTQKDARRTLQDSIVGVHLRVAKAAARTALTTAATITTRRNAQKAISKHMMFLVFAFIFEELAPLELYFAYRKDVF